MLRQGCCSDRGGSSWDLTLKQLHAVVSQVKPSSIHGYSNRGGGGGAFKLTLFKVMAFPRIKKALLLYLFEFTAIKNKHFNNLEHRK